MPIRSVPPTHKGLSEQPELHRSKTIGLTGTGSTHHVPGVTGTVRNVRGVIVRWTIPHPASVGEANQGGDRAVATELLIR